MKGIVKGNAIGHRKRMTDNQEYVCVMIEGSVSGFTAMPFTDGIAEPERELCVWVKAEHFYRTIDMKGD
jgi:hypothetical protein